jgi:hypothetical protein
MERKLLDRGIIYIVWGGDPKVEHALHRSRQSVAAVHPELPVEVIKICETDPVKGLLAKAMMFDKSPFRETLYLDADTIVMGRLDFGFDKAVQFGLACSICECPWARRAAGISGDLVEYNTGVLFFTRRARPLFDAWASLSQKIDSGIVFVDSNGRINKMKHNDQGSFAAAIDQTEAAPFVLPLNWNFRPQWNLSFFGPIKVWHDYSDPPSFFAEVARYYTNPAAIIQYHAAAR